MPKNLIGDRLKSLRINLGLTQEEVGSRVSVSKQTLYKYENGIVTNIPSDKIELLANVYHVTPAYIMGWEQSPAPAPDDLPVLNAKDEREITRMMDDMKDKLMQEEGLMFDGQPATAESIQSILDAMQIGMEMAKKRNKAKYTPKKFRHED